MSTAGTTTPPLVARAPAAGRLVPERQTRTTLRVEALALAGLAALCAGLIALTWNSWGDLSLDTGYDLVAAARTDAGEYPYRDYTYFYGPLAPLLLGQAFDVLGTSVGSAVAVGLVLALAIVGATYALARSLAGGLAGFLAAALAATAAFSNANNSFVLPHTLSMPLAILLSFCALLAAIRVARRGGERWLAVAGACAGAVALNRPEFTAAIFGALGSWLLLRALDRRSRATTGSLREVALVAVPALALPALAYGTVLTRVSLGALVSDNLYPVDFVREAGHVVLDAGAPLTAGSFARLAGMAVLYAFGVVAIVGVGRALASRGRLRTAAFGACALAAIGFLGALAVRPETLRHYLDYAYAWIPAGAVVFAIVLLLRFRRRTGAWRASAQAELLATAFLALVAAKNYAGFHPQPNPLFPPEAPYLLPFAAAFLAWLHLRELARFGAGVRLLGASWLALLATAGAVLVIGDARDESVTVAGPHGELRALPADGPAYQGALDTIEARTRPGEPILLAPQMSALYAMSGRENPLPQISLLPGVLGDGAAEQRALESMNDQGVRLAIVDRAPLTTYERGPFGRGFYRRIGRWLTTEFRRTAVLRGSGGDPRVLEVWQRRSR